MYKNLFTATVILGLYGTFLQGYKENINHPLNRIDFSYVITLQDTADYNQETWQDIKNQIAAMHVVDKPLAETLAKLGVLHNYILKNRDDKTNLSITGNIYCSTDTESLSERPDTHPLAQPEPDKDIQTQFLHLWIEKGKLDRGTWDLICEKTCNLIDYCRETEGNKIKFHYVLEEIKSIYAQIGVQ